MQRNPSSAERISNGLPSELRKGQGETRRQKELRIADEETAIEESKGEKHKDGRQVTGQESGRPEVKSRLLLVEDNLINQKVLRRQLQARGFVVEVAGNGQEAVDAFRDKRPKKFDIILMDQEMPIKDGNTAAKEIRQLEEEALQNTQEEGRRTAILGVSANVREAQRVSMKDAGMDDIISKPFKVDDLVQTIKDLIE